MDELQRQLTAALEQIETLQQLVDSQAATIRDLRYQQSGRGLLTDSIYRQDGFNTRGHGE